MLKGPPLQHYQKHTGVFRNAAQSLVHPWSLTLGDGYMVLIIELNTICTNHLTQCIHRCNVKRYIKFKYCLYYCSNFQKS